MVMQSINIYPLTRPEDLVSVESVIGQLVFGLETSSDGDTSLSISPISGCLRYADETRLWRGGSSGLGSARAAEDAARTFLARANHVVSRYRPSSGPAVPALFPTDIKTAGVGVGLDFDQNQPMHWLVRLVARAASGGLTLSTLTGGEDGTGELGRPVIGGAVMPTVFAPTSPQSPQSPAQPPLEGAEPAAIVIGGTIDVRVDGDGVVCGVVSHWRPCQPRAVTSTPRLPPPESNEKISIVYRVGGEDEPQRFLSPFYLLPGSDDDGPSLVPASEYSLAAAIHVDEDGVLSAETAGHRPDTELRYSWFAWRLDDPDADPTSLDDRDRLTLGPGTHNVVLDVVDPTTTAICRAQAIISSPAPDMASANADLGTGAFGTKP
jgi:hypothetical protein